MPNSAVFLIIDQLPSLWLGAYGNTIVETSSFNRLAASSLVFDFAIADCLNLRSAYERLWSHLETDAETILITDDPQVANHSQAKFDRVILIEQAPVTEAASDPSSTQLANFFAQATAWLNEELEEGQLCWIHSQGLGGAWDAPYEWRLKFTGEEDPLPPKFVDCPQRQLKSDERDPDLILGYQQAAAAQVALIDDCLGVLLDELDASPLSNRLLLGCASVRGFGLGEHGLIGVEHHLNFEFVQVPLMLRFPKTLTDDKPDYLRIGRSGSLVTLRFIPELLQAWLNEDHQQVETILSQVDSILPQKQHQVISIVNDQFEAIQTHAWKLIRNQTGEVQLYAKPDDRWEVNDVSDRCPLIVEKLVDLLDRRIGWESTAAQPLELDEELAFRRD